MVLRKRERACGKGKEEVDTWRKERDTLREQGDVVVYETWGRPQIESWGIEYIYMVPAEWADGGDWICMLMEGLSGFCMRR